jgi:hypothetical protein
MGRGAGPVTVTRRTLEFDELGEDELQEMFVFNGPERIKRVEKKINKNLKPYMRKNGSS